jgi:phosphopantothenoylcysteine decarboxylase/phosphopantothenate--cysteine ligase
MKFLITAGPTREFIDPFRYISNPSSGKMGYALACSARDKGQNVVLISGPVDLPEIVGVELVSVVSALEMRKAVMEHFPFSNVVIMSAAVSDYRPAAKLASKLKNDRSSFKLDFVRNPDILGELGRKKGRKILVGFSADTDNIIDNARKKMEIKNLDLVVANNITSPGAGFSHDTNRVVVLNGAGKIEFWPLLPKLEVADRIVEKILALARKR